MRTTLSCPGCDRDVADANARWCGACGHPLSRSEPRTPVAASRDVVLPVPDDEQDEPGATEGRAPFSARSRLVGAAVVLVVLGGLLAVQASRQPPAEPHGYTSRGVPERTGVAAVETLARPTRVAWQTAVELSGFTPAGAAVHASDELVFVLDLDGEQGVTAHDGSRGDVRWTRSDLALSEATPVVSGDTLVVGTRDGGRTALAPDGTTRWVRPQGLSSPVVAGGGIADIQRSAVVELFDPTTGESRWSVDIAESLDASAQYVLPGGPADLVVVLASRPQGLELGSNPELETAHLVAVEARTGEIRWTIDLPSGLAWFQAPVAIDEQIAVAANVSEIVYWDLDSGRRLARHVRDIAFRPLAVTAADGAAVLLDPLGTVTALDPDGTTRWVAETTLPATLDVRGARVLISTRDRITLHDAGTGRVAGGLPVDAESRLGPPGPDGSAFLLRRDGRLVGYDPAGGSRFEAPTVVPAAPPPAVADDTLFLATGAGVSVLSGDDGAPIWEYRSTDPTASIAGDLYAPVVAEDVVILSPARSQPLVVGGVFALQRDTGILAWQRLTDRPSPRGPLTLDRDLAVLPVEDELHGHAPVGGRRALAATAYGLRGPIAAAGGLLVAASAPGEAGPGGRTIIAIRRADRSRVWEEPADACTPPAVADETVVVGTGTGFRALDLGTGDERWEAAVVERPVCGDLVVGGGRVVGVSAGVVLTAVELGDGRPAWEIDLPAAAAASPVLIGDEVVVPLVDGRLLAVAVADGEERWSAAMNGIPAASPIVVDGRLVVLLRDGRLVAYEAE